jgi:hypothetical protein
VLLYDETRKPCASTPEATLLLEGFGSKTMTSGVRFPGVVAGDSLATGTTLYTVRAIVQTEGSKFVEVDAGTTHLRGTAQ